MQDIRNLEEILPFDPLNPAWGGSDGYNIIKELCNGTPAFIKKTLTQSILLFTRCALPVLAMWQNVTGTSDSWEKLYVALGLALLNRGVCSYFNFTAASAA